MAPAYLADRRRGDTASWPRAATAPCMAARWTEDRWRLQDIPCPVCMLCRAESAPHGLTRGVAAGSFRCTTRSVSDTSSDTASDTLSHGGYMRASCRLRSAWEVDWDDWRAHHRGHGRALAEVHTVCAYALGPRAGRSAGFADSMGVGAALLAVRTVVSGVCLPGLLFVYWRSVLRTVCLVDALQLCLYDRHPARISAYSILRNSGAHIYVHQRYVS